MKHYLLSGLLILGLIVSGCQQKEDLEPQTTELNRITLDATALTMSIGEKHTFTVTTEPADIDGITLQWNSSDSEIASVDNDGTVTAIAEGNAVITVNCNDISASCTVNVEDETVELESISIEPSEAEIAIGDTLILTAVTEPEDISLTLNWTSSDESIVTVNNNGEAVGVASGNAVITVEADGKIATCNIKVNAIEAESITLSPTSVTLMEGESTYITATILPENTSDKTLTWSSSDNTVAEINASGMITAISTGNATITAETVNGKTANCSVTVILKPQTGDILYSDGTWSTDIDNTKTAIGVIFYSGDITAYDSELAQDFPYCTHGLAISLNEITNTAWQSGYIDYDNSVSSWIEANTEFGSILTDNENINQPIGYRNTKAIKAFNAATENSGWPVEAVQCLTTFSESYPVPESTSGWYLPSIKEISLFTAGEQDGNILDIASKEMLNQINVVLENLGAKKLGGIISFIPGMYWSSSEIDKNECYYMQTMNGSLMNTSKYEVFSIRPILAF